VTLRSGTLRIDTPAPPPDEPGRRLWIVIVDDNLDDRVEARRLLLTDGYRRYRFSEAATGAAGVQLLVDSAPARPDCVLLDYHLPDISGPEVLALLADGDGIMVCPVVVLTGAMGLEIGRDVLRAGAQDFIGKSWLTGPGLARAIDNARERWAMAHDLRARKARLVTSEARQRELFEAARDAESRLRLALQASRTGIWTWDPSSDVVTWSPECFDISGQRTDQFDATGAAFFAMVHDEDRVRVEASVQAAIVEHTLYACEFRLVRPNGDEVWVQNLGRASYDEGGSVTGVIGTLIDINDRVLTERAFRAGEQATQTALEEAKHALHMRDQMVSLISHDLKNPLHVIMMGLGALRLQLDDLPQAKGERFATLLDRMSRQTTRMDKLLDELVDMARVHAGAPLPIERQRFDLSELVQSVAEEHRQISPRHRIDVHATEQLVGEWDRRRLERVVTNLLSNAIKYSPSGGTVVVSTFLDAREDATLAVLRVSDQGMGISAADLPRVFQWFSRAENARKTTIPGTGIGLAGAREIVLHHGGTITVESEESAGSTFTVTLPAGSPS
jgi:PAS domain S-box-containing protein